MTDAATAFFERLAEGDHVPLPNRAAGVIRFEVVDGKKTERWLVDVGEGKIDVSRRNGAAECVVRADRKLFNGMASGKVNAFAATLRGAVAVAGDPTLLVLFQRLLPGPPSAARR